VDDEEAVRKFVYRLLSQNGYSVLEAATPREAIKLCEVRHDIRLLLTDMVMPQMSGYALAKNITALTPRMKVIFMSGYTDNAITQQHIMDPGVTLLEKPLRADVVLRKVRETLDAAAPL
jgi:CheY-like chemotaxis protein